MGYTLAIRIGEPLAVARDGSSLLAWTTSAEQDYAALARVPDAEIHLRVTLRPRDPVTLEAQPYYLTSAPRLHTEPTDTPPSTQHLARLLSSWRLSRRAAEAGTLLGPSEASLGVLAIEDADGLLAGWADLDWSAAAAEVALGGRRRADGSAYPYASYRVVFEGLVEDLVARPEGGWEVQLVGDKRRLDQLVAGELFRGMGGALVLAKGGRARSKEGRSLPGLLLPGPLGLLWRGRLLQYPDATQLGGLIRIGTDSGLAVDEAGRLRLYLGGTSSTLLASGTLPLEQPLTVAASVAADGKAAVVWVGASGATLSQVAAGSTASARAASGAIVLGTHEQAGSETGLGCEIWEAAIYAREISIEEVAAWADAPLVEVADDLTLLEAWRFEEGIGEAAIGERGALDLAIEEGTWTSSLEGDDPEAFPGGPGGQTKPRVYGVASNVPLVLVSTPWQDYTWSDGASADLRAVRVGGARLVLDEVIEAPAAGAMIFEAATRSIRLAPGLTAHRLVPGQASPLVVGQRIDVAGTASNDGTYTIRAGGISRDGRTIRVAEDLASESAPLGASIRSTPSEVQATYDLARSTVRLASAPAGPLTADVVGWLPAGRSACRYSELLAEILGATSIDSAALAWDPEIGVWIAPGASPTRRELADAIAASALSWWIEARGGGYRIGTLRPPEGSARAWLGPAAIVSIAPIATATPATRLTVGYSRTWQVQDADSLVGSVASSDRALWSQPLRLLAREIPGVAARYPLAAPRELVETHLVRRRDAQRYLDLATSLYSAKRRWWEVVVAGLGLGALDIDDVVAVQHPEPTFGLQAGQLARILAIEEDVGAGTTTLEVFA